MPNTHVQVSQYLHSRKWDTRVAAARAVGAIAENVKHSSLIELAGCVDARLSEAAISATFDDVATWQNGHSKIGSGTSFRRSTLFLIHLFIYFYLFCFVDFITFMLCDAHCAVSSHDLSYY